MAIYPQNLPLFVENRYGYSESPDSARVQMDGGPTRVRRMSRQSDTIFSVATKMTGSQLSVFESWYRHDIDNGVDWFDIDLFVGLGMQSHSARFLGKPKRQKDGKRAWIVSASLEVRQRVIMSEDDLLVAIYGDSDLTIFSDFLSGVLSSYDDGF